MIDHLLSPRYAKVLFEIDLAADGLQERLKDFKALLHIFRENPKLEKFFTSPHIVLSDKKTILHNTLSARFDTLFLSFLFYLIQKNRLKSVAPIEKEYRLMVNKHLGIWEADITTATSLDADSEVKLIQKLESNFHKKIRLNKIIDPKIIGGAILVIANEMVDWSIKGRLKKLKEHLIAIHVYEQEAP